MLHLNRRDARVWQEWDHHEVDSVAEKTSFICRFKITMSWRAKICCAKGFLPAHNNSANLKFIIDNAITTTTLA